MEASTRPGPGEGLGDLLEKNKTSAPRGLYHCGVIDGAPVENLTLGAASCPLRCRAYKDDDDQEGFVVPGALCRLTDADYNRSMKKLGRLICEWKGSNPPAKVGEKRRRGVGPGENYTHARIYDTGGNALDVRAENCEPMTRYVYIYPIAAEDQRYGQKPTIEEMKTGKTTERVEGELDRLKELCEHKERELLTAMELEGKSAERDAKKMEGKILDPAAAAAIEVAQAAKKTTRGRKK